MSENQSVDDFGSAFEKPVILVGICSCRAYSEKRSAVRETWLTRPVSAIECRFFVGRGEPLDAEPDTISVDADDSYDFLPQKVIAFFRHALENFEFDWLFKCDDDTYVALDRLHALTTMGGDLVGNETLANRGSPSGGAGYLLSRQIVNRIVEDHALSLFGAEDIIVGEAAVGHGAKPVSTERLRWNANPCPTADNNLITAHWCTPDRMRAIHTALVKKPSKTIQANNRNWNDELLFFDNGYFLRRQSGCNGRWESEVETDYKLLWFDWEQENLVIDQNGKGWVMKGHRSPWLGSESMAIAVWSTSGTLGLPHLGTFLEMNPEVPIHVIHSKVETQTSGGLVAWRNRDRMIRKWWLESGNLLQFDRVLFLEWDVLFRDSLHEILPVGDFICCDVKAPDISDWEWFGETDALPEQMRRDAWGASPFAVISLSRRCLQSMMEHPLAERLFEADIFCELRLPTLAKHCGFELIESRVSMPDCQFFPMTPSPGRGVWHSVKGP